MYVDTYGIWSLKHFEWCMMHVGYPPPTLGRSISLKMNWMTKKPLTYSTVVLYSCTVGLSPNCGKLIELSFHLITLRIRKPCVFFPYSYYRYNNSFINRHGNHTIQRQKKWQPQEAEELKKLEEFELKKKREECTGMFWRSDPRKKRTFAPFKIWPRDGAKLRGIIVEAKGERWLIAKQVAQKGSDKRKDAPKDTAILFEFDKHSYLEWVIE